MRERDYRMTEHWVPVSIDEVQYADFIGVKPTENPDGTMFFSIFPGGGMMLGKSDRALLVESVPVRLLPRGDRVKVCPEDMDAAKTELRYFFEFKAADTHPGN